MVEIFSASALVVDTANALLVGSGFVVRRLGNRLYVSKTVGEATVSDVMNVRGIALIEEYMGAMVIGNVIILQPIQ